MVDVEAIAAEGLVARERLATLREAVADFLAAGDDANRVAVDSEPAFTYASDRLSQARRRLLAALEYEGRDSGSQYLRAERAEAALGVLVKACQKDGLCLVCGEAFHGDFCPVEHAAALAEERDLCLASDGREQVLADLANMVNGHELNEPDAPWIAEIERCINKVKVEERESAVRLVEAGLRAECEKRWKGPTDIRCESRACDGRRCDDCPRDDPYRVLDLLRVHLKATSLWRRARRDK